MDQDPVFKSLPKTERLDPVRLARGERGIWQRRFWEHVVRDERDFRKHIEYCWFNPVKHEHVTRVEEWPYSSFHRDHRDAPKPGDLERAMAEFAQATSGDKFGERE